jgi:hypothetical protein
MTMKSLPTKIVLALTLGAFAACMAPGITDTASRTGTDAQAVHGLGNNLVECPAQETSSSTEIVTPLGGLVSVGGTSVSIPAGALLSPATVTVTLPASQFMEVDISVEGVEHFIFELPITVTVSYARCARSNIDKFPLTAWYIDSQTKALLEPMGGVDNKLTETVTFTTPHLSGYALAD